MLSKDTEKRAYISEMDLKQALGIDSGHWAFQGLWQLSDIIQISSETQCRSRSLRTETNIQQDVKCELKAKPCECVRTEFLSKR